MGEPKCTSYTEDDDYSDRPCSCPVCGGWIKWDENGEPTCNKCGAELAKLPDVDEETKEPLEYEKICALSGRKKTKETTAEERKTNRLVKAGRKAWKGWL